MGNKIRIYKGHNTSNTRKAPSDHLKSLTCIHFLCFRLRS